MGDRESITFYNRKRKQAVIYDRNRKEFIHLMNNYIKMS
jgi:hypothetical protein